MSFYCKYCGRDYKDIKYMLTCSCAKSPTKKHVMKEIIRTLLSVNIVGVVMMTQNICLHAVVLSRQLNIMNYFKLISN